MPTNEYSAGAVKFSFWFAEFRKIVSLLQAGKSMVQIKELAASENIFSAATPLRSKQIFATVSARVLSLPSVYYELMESSGIETQKLIALISIMETEPLFFAFMNEVYREKLIKGDTVLKDADIRVFFAGIQRESEKAANWTDITIYRLQKTYKIYLTEAGLLERGKGDRRIIKPLVEERLSCLLIDAKKERILNVFADER
jgi:hypothetical protein